MKSLQTRKLIRFYVRNGFYLELLKIEIRSPLCNSNTVITNKLQLYRVAGGVFLRSSFQSGGGKAHFNHGEAHNLNFIMIT